MKEVERVGKDPIYWVRREASFALGALAKAVPVEVVEVSLVRVVIIKIFTLTNISILASCLRFLAPGFCLACSAFSLVRPPRHVDASQSQTASCSCS